MDKEALRNELEIRRSIKADTARFQDMQTQAIARIEAQLAEAEKPELRHGDYGLDKDGFFFLREDGSLWTKYYELGNKTISRSLNKTGNASQRRVWASQILGNTFRDLKARQEPLKAFEIDNGTSQTIRVKISGGFLRMRDDDGFMLIKKCELPAFILNLQRLVITPKEASGE